jgi:site-specific recombinase XerD
MTAIAPHITTFLRERLPVQRGASVHTCDSYAYAFQLLFEFASQQYQVPPSGLQLEQIDAPLVLAFLDHLEAKRGNSPNTRNVRLAAIKSFMRFCEYRVVSLYRVQVVFRNKKIYQKTILQNPRGAAGLRRWTIKATPAAILAFIVDFSVQGQKIL